MLPPTRDGCLVNVHGYGECIAIDWVDWRGITDRVVSGSEISGIQHRENYC